MGYILSLQTLERAEPEGVTALLASTFSVGLCRSTVSAAC